MSGALLVILATDMFEKLHIDDPVGALSVHGIGGIWVQISFLMCSKCYCTPIGVLSAVLRPILISRHRRRVSH